VIIQDDRANSRQVVSRAKTGSGERSVRLLQIANKKKKKKKKI